jgi:protein-S-isoprenylcysteine O-methyltransferase Ste14
MEATVFRRIAYLAYGGVCYIAFVLSISYAVGFVGNYWQEFGWTGPWFLSMDVGPTAPIEEALLVDGLLLALFAVQHSVMARPGFKRGWTRVVPTAIERSTFVLAASFCLALLFWQWRPVGSVVWDTSSSRLAIALIVLSLAGWAVALLSTFMIDHADLLGLRQVVGAFRGKPIPAAEFATPGFYRAVRHPLYLGFLIAFWATPVMTVGHLFFAGAMTAYVLGAIQLEERDLVAHYGEAYRAYRRRVGMLVPLPRWDRKRGGGAEASRPSGLVSKGDASASRGAPGTPSERPATL